MGANKRLQKEKIMQCVGCGRRPHEIPEYVAYAGSNDPVACETFVRNEDGTYNGEADTFCCTSCYIRRGAPSHPRGWKAPAKIPYRSKGVMTDHVLGVRRCLIPHLL